MDSPNEFTTHARGAQKSLTEARRFLTFLTANVTRICGGMLGPEEANAYSQLAELSTALHDAEESVLALISIEDAWRAEAARKAAAVTEASNVAVDAKRAKKSALREARQ